MLIKTTYFYSPPESFSKGKIFISDDEAYHLTKVLRAKIGDEFFVTNGIGDVFRARLEKSHKKGIVAEIVDEVESMKSPSLDICLGMGIVKPKLMELALDWAIQLGINEFIPLMTSYTLKEFRKESERYIRLEKVAIRSMKQSKRTWLPTIYPTIELNEYLKKYRQNFDGILYADYEGVPSPPKRMIQPDRRILLIVGAEGGLSTSEKAELNEYGAVPVSLGNTRLRTETAAVTIVTKLLVWTGNI